MRTETSGRSRRRERGIFSLVEVLLATIVLALSATATAYWVETVGNLARESDDRTVAETLVKNLESVIQPLPFREPGTPLTSLGPERGEDLSTFDDVDDFHGFVSSPPIDAERSPISSLSAWEVEIDVRSVSPSDLEPVTSGDLRRVTVIVRRGGDEVARDSWLRARSPFE